MTFIQLFFLNLIGMKPYDTKGWTRANKNILFIAWKSEMAVLETNFSVSSYLMSRWRVTTSDSVGPELSFG